MSADKPVRLMLTSTEAVEVRRQLGVNISTEAAPVGLREMVRVRRLVRQAFGVTP